MRERHVFAMLPIAKGVVASSASCCPSAGGQRTSGLARRVSSQRFVGASESRMAQRSVQRLEGRHRMVVRSLVGAFTCVSYRRPNPSVKRTVNGGPRSAGFVEAVPPLSAAYLIR